MSMSYNVTFASGWSWGLMHTMQFTRRSENSSVTMLALAGSSTCIPPATPTLEHGNVSRTHFDSTSFNHSMALRVPISGHPCISLIELQRFIKAQMIQKFWPALSTDLRKFGQLTIEIIKSKQILASCAMWQFLYRPYCVTYTVYLQGWDRDSLSWKLSKGPVILLVTN